MITEFEVEIIASRRWWHVPCLWFLLLVWAPVAQAYQERVVMAVTEQACIVRVEVDDQAHALRIRILPESSACGCSLSTMQTVVKAAFAQLDLEQPATGYGSLFLGRLVGYPWLSSSLVMFASRDDRWDRNKGRPVSGSYNGYVRDVLSRREVIDQFNEILTSAGYRVQAVEVEKVLVERAGKLPTTEPKLKSSAKVPFDALVWLVLERK